MPFIITKRVQEILSAAMTNIDANFPWKLTEDYIEPEARLEVYFALEDAVQVFGAKIYDFDHAFPTTQQLASRVYDEMNGFRQIHDVTKDLENIEAVLNDEIATLIVNHRPDRGYHH